MPTYDVECSACGIQESISLKLADLDEWDQTSACPSCKAGAGAFRRVIRSAPASHRPSKAGSSAKDDMRQKSLKRINSDQTAEAREIVAKGTYEGF